MAGDRVDVWNERYAAVGRVPFTEPHPEVVRLLGGRTPGRVVDVGAGEGRHAIWLAERGWQVTALDFSEAGVAAGRRLSTGRDVGVEWVVGDVMTWAPEHAGFDVALVCYVFLEAEVLRRVAGWLQPEGELVVIGHGPDSAGAPGHGPRNPAYRHTVATMRERAAGLVVDRCEEVEVLHEGTEPSVDVVLVARGRSS